MLIKVRTLTGKEIELDIEPDYKALVRYRLKEDLELMLCRADDKTASEYNLEGGATLHLVLALRGGLLL
ncbi:hypothetical protein Egran_01525 [Elaphomyces granulatus]|uniref:Ubiquitin-like domain-containing protein n=1 Tax=Elaphomyces granulatus TaxID=519963 RepID=A0A232M2U6_9EURO|nr:hypothetical protein Egran_01525 [Elaphomyces granulatus]